MRTLLAFILLVITASVRAADFEELGTGAAGLNARFAAEGGPVPAVTAPPSDPREDMPRALGFIDKDFPESVWRPPKSRGGMKAMLSIPSKLDLRPRLSPIENQGSNCGSCWSFALTAVHRDGHKAEGRDPGRISQEWLVEKNSHGYGCQGGSFDAADDLVAPKGQPAWDDCPYEQGMEGKAQCRADLKPAAHITGWGLLGKKATGPSPKDIETFIVESGHPVASVIHAKPMAFMKYKGGIFDQCEAGQVDHMIVIVGWDNEGAQFDRYGNLPPGKGFWIIRNSWGTRWGEEGYLRIKMTDASGAKCNNVAQYAAYEEFE